MCACLVNIYCIQSIRGCMDVWMSGLFTIKDCMFFICYVLCIQFVLLRISCCLVFLFFRSSFQYIILIRPSSCRLCVLRLKYMFMYMILGNVCPLRTFKNCTFKNVCRILCLILLVGWCIIFFI